MGKYLANLSSRNSRQIAARISCGPFLLSETRTARGFLNLVMMTWATRKEVGTSALMRASCCRPRLWKLLLPDAAKPGQAGLRNCIKCRKECASAYSNTFVYTRFDAPFGLRPGSVRRSADRADGSGVYCGGSTPLSLYTGARAVFPCGGQQWMEGIGTVCSCARIAGCHI